MGTLINKINDRRRKVKLSEFYAQLQRLRRHPAVVAFHLAGHAALPRGADFDDGSKARVGPH